MRAVLLLAAALTLTSCVAEVESGPVVVVPTGLLTVDWSISGYQDPGDCRRSDADVINVALETSDGFFVGEFTDVCEAFRTSIELESGDYYGDAVLLDPFGAQRTTAVDLGLVRIFGDDELVVPVDFPSDSFY
jgi:hypothetical protein